MLESWGCAGRETCQSLPAAPQGRTISRESTKQDNSDLREEVANVQNTLETFRQALAQKFKLIEGQISGLQRTIDALGKSSADFTKATSSGPISQVTPRQLSPKFSHDVLAAQSDQSDRLNLLEKSSQSMQSQLESIAAKMEEKEAKKLEEQGKEEELKRLQEQQREQEALLCTQETPEKREGKLLEDMPDDEQVVTNNFLKEEVAKIQSWRKEMEAWRMGLETSQADIENTEMVVPKVTPRRDSGIIADEVIDVVSKQLAYAWEESVYDALMVTFLHRIDTGWFPSSIVLFGFILNIAIIIIVLVIIGSDAFLQGDFDAETLQKWRNTDAHSYENAHALTKQTLITRVCNMDDTLSFAENQVNTIEDIERYLTGNTGFLLCNVAILVWAFCCASEIRRSLRFLGAVWHLPRMDHSVIALTEDNGVDFEGLSIARALAGGGIGLLRMGFAITLLLTGGAWLASTSGIEDLLLNASALGFVLDIDNIIFEVVAPLKVIGILRLIKPASLPAVIGLHWFPTIFVWVIFGFMLFTNVALLLPYLDSMDSVLKVMCHPIETRTIAVAQNPLGWVMFTPSTPEWGQEPGALNLQNDIAASIINSPDEWKDYAVQFDDFAHMQWSATVNLDVLANSFHCMDGNTMRNSSAIGKRLYGVTGNRSLISMTSCEQAKPLCHELSKVGTNMRLLCPVTCGCGNKLAGMWDLGRASHGCPQLPCQRRLLFGLKGKRHPCKDKTQTWLNQSSGWGLLLHRLNDTRTIPAEGVANMSRLGCEAFQFWSNGRLRDVCSMNSATGDQGAAPFCPVACHCKNAEEVGSLEVCPGFCPQSCCLDES